AVSLNGVEAGLARVAPNLDSASRTLGVGPAGTFVRIHAPLLKGGLLTAFLITFVDIMKELPATLILRPFNFDTLATRAYQLAADERLAFAAVPSLMIVAVGLIPVIVLSRQIAHADRRKGTVARGQESAYAASPAPGVDPLGENPGAAPAPIAPPGAGEGAKAAA
ncbi:MAG: ABC transporter permease subunit, partial [Pseudomonadota bacterium]